MLYIVELGTASVMFSTSVIKYTASAQDFPNKKMQLDM